MTAIELSEGIEDERERKLVQKYLNERIVPSGDAQEDLRFARMAVNSLKNGLIAEEIGRSVPPKSFNSGAGAPPKQAEKELELTKEELQFTRPPFNLTPAEIVKTRKG